MRRAVKREAAKRDLLRHFVYLAENATPEVARRFKEAARKTFSKLAETPGMGAPGRFVAERTPMSVYGESPVLSDTSSPIAR
jgi:plasmid stabilization system protein ParE